MGCWVGRGAACPGQARLSPSACPDRWSKPAFSAAGHGRMCVGAQENADGAGSAPRGGPTPIAHAPYRHGPLFCFLDEERVSEDCSGDRHAQGRADTHRGHHVQ